MAGPRNSRNWCATTPGQPALAQAEGFDFVDLKHCHGYLLHEFLAARHRPGRFGGPRLEDRTRLCFEILDAVRDAAPGLAVGVRLSAFDRVPHRPADADEAEEKRGRRLGRGVPEPHPRPYDLGFGVDQEAPERSDLREAVALVRALVEAGVRWFNVSAGSPYYVPHIQRPAAFPPSDGYAPPEDPLAGVARLLQAARTVKAEVPEAIVVSTGWTYLQDYLPHVAQACLREGWFDAVGLGRMMLSYPAPARRRDGGPPAAAASPVPDLQRLHHRPPKRNGVGMLPARRLLQASSGAREPGEAQARHQLE